MFPIISKTLIYVLIPVLFAQDNWQGLDEDSLHFENDITNRDLFGYNEGESDDSADNINKIEDEDLANTREAIFMSDDPTDNDCSIFPNQTFYRPHFFSCHNDGKLFSMRSFLFITQNFLTFRSSPEIGGTRFGRREHHRRLSLSIRLYPICSILFRCDKFRKSKVIFLRLTYSSDTTTFEPKFTSIKDGLGG